MWKLAFFGRSPSPTQKLYMTIKIDRVDGTYPKKIKNIKRPVQYTFLEPAYLNRHQIALVEKFLIFQQMEQKLGDRQHHRLANIVCFNGSRMI